MLEAVGFYATAPDTSYEVYVVNKVTGEADLTFQKKAASGSFSNAGYYTVKLDKPVLLSDGDRYAVIVYVRTPGSERLKSPGIVCLRADAATPNSRASLKFLPSTKPQIVPPAKLSPPPTRSTIGRILYSLE